MMDVWMSLLKIVSLLVAGSFGILGLTTEFKDEKRKITKWGKFALGGILISTLLAVGLYGLEAANAKAAAQRAQADARKREQEAAAFSRGIDEGLKRQQAALIELDKVRQDSQETLVGQNRNLQKTSEVSHGLQTTLVQQNKMLQGQEKSAGAQLQQLKLQEKVLEESQLLYLAQHTLAGLEIPGNCYLKSSENAGNFR